MGNCGSSLETKNDVVVMNKFRAFAKKYKIPEEFIFHYRKLRNMKIVIVADDSNSMRADAYSGELLTQEEKKSLLIPSRFDELKMMIRMILEFAGILSDQGVDVRFLNRGQTSVSNGCNSTLQGRTIIMNWTNWSSILMKRNLCVL
jgi:hypothetical protein